MDFNINRFNVNSLGPLFGIVIFFVVIALILFFVLLGIFIAGKWKMYKKAGKDGWESIIPFYNDWVYVEIAGLNWWWFLLVVCSGLISIHNGSDGDSSFIIVISSLVGRFVCNYNISKKFNKSISFAVLMTIFPFIVIPIIGFSNEYVWDDSVSVSLNGPFDKNDTDSGNSNSYHDENAKFCSNCGKKIKKSDKFCSNCGKEI